MVSDAAHDDRTIIRVLPRPSELQSILRYSVFSTVL
ncbi:hypothetical protein RSAG8_00421, partial [Rhizoctonia solani AG-8 WAC10335]